ncbi:MAG TPA: 30S ribosomal protein S8, partial [Rubrobacteraceae bacterium]
MSVNDPIADFLTRIRNAQMAKHDTAVIPHSKMKADI